MSSKVFAVPFSGTVAASGDVDLWEILPADDLPCKIRGLRLGQTSEVGDTAEEGLRVSIIRMTATVTSGSGGAAGAPEQVDLSGQTPGFAAEVGNATVATTTGATEVIEDMSWNVRNSPFEVWYPDPAFAPKAVQSEALLVRLQTTVADDLSFAGTLWVEEG